MEREYAMLVEQEDDLERFPLIDDPSAKNPRPSYTRCIGGCLIVNNKDCCNQCFGVKQCRVTSIVLLLNAIAALLHLTLFVTLLVLVVRDRPDPFTKPLLQSITVWQEFDATNRTCELPVCVQTANDGNFTIFSKSVENGELTLEYLILSFSALSFLFQGVRPWVGLQPLKGQEKDYLAEVRARVNWLRWVEYSFSATCMILAISFVVDPNIEFSTVLMVSTSTAATQFCGLVGELMLEDNKQTGIRQELVVPAWVIHVTGWLLQFGVFTTIFNSYFQSVEYAQQDDTNAAEPPSFVTMIVVGEALLFSSFGITQLLDFVDRTCNVDLCCGRDPGTAFELVFIGLSLSAKFFLSIVVAANLWINPEA